VFDGLVFFNKENEALNFVDKIKLLKRNNLSGVISLEFFDRNSLELLKPEYPFVPHAEAAVYFEQECRNEKEHSFLIEKWAVLIEEYGASLDISLLADTPKEREKIFKFRHRLPQLINEFLRQHKQIKAATDIAVPCENFREMYNFYMDTAKESGLEYVNFGHIGESHLHFNFLPKSDSENLEAKKYLKIFCEKAVSLGGTVSAEHGIGKIKKPYLKIMYDGEQIREMAALKKYFDPYCLVGLDNIFEKELLFKI
jgi:D-lactate dehydrogenase (cytochrome)